MRSDVIEQNSGQQWRLKHTAISKEIDVTATPSGGGAVAAVPVPAGAYVSKVGVLCTGAVVSSDFDVGDGANTDRYMEGITTMATADLVMAPNVATGVDISAGEVGAHLYSSADTIDVLVNNTATTGSVKVLVWYYIP